MTFDVILVTDTANIEEPKWTRGYGAHRLASHLRIHGYTVLVIDFCSAMTFDHWKDICQYAIGDNTQLVGFSTTWWPYRDTEKEKVRKNWIEYLAVQAGNAPSWKSDEFMYNVVTGNAKEWVDVVKEKNKKIKIAIGGPKLDWYKDFPADYFINGLGENQLLDLLTEKKRIWPKIIEHDINSTNREWGWKTSTTFYTDYDFLHYNERLNLEVARGCKFHCNFCSFPLLGQKDIAKYYKAEDTIYRELMTNWEQYGIYQYNIADDTFNDDIEKLKMMSRVVNKLPFRPRFFTYNRLDLIATQPEQIELLEEIGNTWMYFGIETFHPVASKFSGKGMSSERRKETLYKMNEAWGDRVAIDAGYIIGLPGEPESYIREQAEWFKRDDCPINHNVSFIALFINPEWSLRFVYPSKIDRHPENFGYQIPDRSKPNYWVKNDGTDITTYERACELVGVFQQEMKKRKNVLQTNHMVDHYLDPIKDYFEPLIEYLKTNA